MRNPLHALVSTAVLLAGWTLAMDSAIGQITYQKPSKEILEVLHAPLPPGISVSPTRDQMLLLDRLRYPSIAVMAQPMLRLAGLRLNPANFGPHAAGSFTGVSIRPMNGSGEDRRIALPADSVWGDPVWSQTGKHFAIPRYTDKSVDLWVVDVVAGVARQAPYVQLNDILSQPIQWLPDGQTLILMTVPKGRAPAPTAPLAPKGPTVQESSGTVAPVRTYQDLLENSHDENLFEYYATAQPVLLDTKTNKTTTWGEPGLYTELSASPDGKNFLATTIHRPFSYLLPYYRFPSTVTILNASGQLVKLVAEVPLEDNIPIEGVRKGPRNFGWLPWNGSSLLWTEAMDDGDPNKKVPFRDELMRLEAPFTEEPTELRKIEHRFAGLSWLETENLTLLRDYDRDKRWTRSYLFDLSKAGSDGDLLFSRNIRDRYNDEGTPLRKTLSNGYSVAIYAEQSLLLSGRGASQQGDRPFLDRMHVPTKEKTRLFQSSGETYEQVITTLSPDGSRFITSRESTSIPPNLFIREKDKDNTTALTTFEDPTPQLRGITKQLVKYERDDGTQLSFTLYLPPNYKEGTRLPAVVWAYPMEYTDPATAGQVSGSEQRFTAIRSYSHLFFLLAGYAVLDETAMPVVGPPETANDSFVKQIVSSAEAAIQKADSMGVIDPNRVAVGGHSYGAFMTANLLAHSRLFRAGLARSGAYNRTLTPFGFQAERRTYWEAPQIYHTLSPFMNADKIKDPILLIHGEADNNSGTFPIQSERMYQAIRGNGGIARLVMLPHESHGYRAEETIEHVLWESIEWLDKHVKHAKPLEKPEGQ